MFVVQKSNEANDHEGQDMRTACRGGGGGGGGGRRTGYNPDIQLWPHISIRLIPMQPLTRDSVVRKGVAEGKGGSSTKSSEN